MALTELSVEGPEFAQRVRKATEVVDRLRANKWDFQSAREVFAKQAAADVIGKEIAVIHDGQMLTRIGRLVMGGVGTEFNLVGPIPARARLRSVDATVLDAIQRQLGTRGLREFAQFRELGRPQRIEFYNYTMFYRLEDFVFWSVLHGAGCFPSTLEHMARHVAGGEIIQNVVYRPNRPPVRREPVIMQAACLMVSFPTKVVEWMDRPLFGGFVKETMHIEYLLTPKPSRVSHPYLPLVDEGMVELQNVRYYMRRFEGVTPKDGLRGPDVPPEGVAVPTGKRS